MPIDYLKQLAMIMPPPEAPIDVDTSILSMNIQEIGTNFPDDYLQYSMQYGSGEICVDPYSWEIWSPGRESYPATVKRFHELFAELRDALEASDLPLGLYPENGGLLPFGVRSDVWFTWKTVGAPDTWKVVVMWSYEPDSYQVYDMGFTEFIYKMSTRKISVAGFHSWWEVSNITFSQSVFSG